MRTEIKRRFHRYVAFILTVVILFTSIANYSVVSAEDYNGLIDAFGIAFEDGAENVNGQYIWTPDEDIANHQFVYRINYSFSDVSGIQPGDIKIYIPKHILKARNDVYADLCELPMTEISQATGGNEFAYYMSGDNIVITNITRSVMASGVIDIAYTTARTTYSYRDMVSSDAPRAYKSSMAAQPVRSFPSVQCHRIARPSSKERTA